MNNISPSLPMHKVCQVYGEAIKKKIVHEIDENTKKYNFVFFEKEPTAKLGTPIKCQFFALYLCLDGELIRHVNQYKYHIKKATLHLVPPDTIYFFENITESSEILVIYFSEEFFISDATQCINDTIKQLLQFHQNDFQAVTLSPEIFGRIRHIYQAIEFELSIQQTDYIAIIQGLVIELLFLLKLYKLVQSTSFKTIHSKSFYIANEYLRLVEKHYLELSQVADYAKLLKITPKYLGEIIKEQFNENALFYIHNRKLKEALYLLRFSNSTLFDISRHLGFSTQSDFNRFFKKHHKMTPKQFKAIFQKIRKNA